MGSFKPGVVDTSMQGTIRTSDESVMPIVKNFKKMKDNASTTTATSGARPPPAGALDTPENVAYFAEYLLLGTTDEEYANANDSSEWDIRNKEFYPRWIPKENLPNED